MGKKIKLKPCPFCGEKVRMIWNCGYHMVRCENDECCFENTKKYNDEKQAANAWNTRKYEFAEVNMGAMTEKEINEKIEDIAMQIEELSASAGGMLYEDIFLKIRENLYIFDLCD